MTALRFMIVPGTRLSLLLTWILPCMVLLIGCMKGDEERRMIELSAELFSTGERADVVIAFSSEMENERRDFVLNALHHRLDRPAIVYTDSENARLLRSLEARRAVRLVVISRGMLARIVALRNPFVAMKQPGTNEQYTILSPGTTVDFRREFIHAIQFEESGVELRTF